MNFLITAGPTYEPLDNVRRLTNFSTGRLGIGLANFLSDQGHEVTLLLSEVSTHKGAIHASRVEVFTTTESLGMLFEKHASQSTDALFHAAAVSDFCFGSIFTRCHDGRLSPVSSKKIPTSLGSLLVELKPTRKLISELRNLYPKSLLVGWKYELDGNSQDAIDKAIHQIEVNRTDACVINGSAYGPGYGLIQLRKQPHSGDKGDDHSLSNQPDYTKNHYSQLQDLYCGLMEYVAR